jgi:7-carboxy-7-deazaguanine synthase (Cx14CxxC type)
MYFCTMAHYKIKEIYYTLQGEGNQTGRAAVFCRFSGCNLWSGREEDRSAAICSFCDTDFRGTDGILGGRYTAAELANTVASLWPIDHKGTPYVVCTGGEPMLQVDEPLIEAFQKSGFEVAIETNGTIPVPSSIDWICVSPKNNAPLRQLHGQELKLVYPQPTAMPNQFKDLSFDHYYLQPMDGPNIQENILQTIQYCQQHPQWKLSIQVHKWLNIP